MLQLEHSAILSTFNRLPFFIKIFFCLFLSGRLRQVLLYLTILDALNYEAFFISFNGSSHICSYLHGACIKVSKGAKIRNQYNQVPHLTQDTTGKVTNSQLDTTNESQEVSPFPAGRKLKNIGN